MPASDIWVALQFIISEYKELPGAQPLMKEIDFSPGLLEKSLNQILVFKKRG